MFSSFLRFTFGYARFTATGPRPERFINLSKKAGYELFDIRCIPGGITAGVKAGDYKKLRRYAKSGSVKLKCTDKRGLPFIMHKYRLRTGVFVGIGMFFGMLAFLSQFAWNITISGLPEGDVALKSKILALLCENGVYTGCKIKDMDAANLPDRLLTELTELSWMSLNTSGTHISVEVSLRDEKPDIPDKNIPCDIIAECDGRITDLKAFCGTPVVKSGDAVLKGDVLIKGLSEFGETRILRHAAGEVTAEVSKQYTLKYELRRREEIKTGRVIKRSVLNFFHLKIPLYLGGISGDYSVQTDEKTLIIGGVKLPVSLTNATFYEKHDTEVYLSEETALSRARAITEKDIASDFPGAEIVSVNDSFYTENDALFLTTEIICKKNIAAEQKILIFGE